MSHAKNGWNDRDAIWGLSRVDPRNHVLHWGTDPARGRGNFGGCLPPLKSSGSPCSWWVFAGLYQCAKLGWIQCSSFDNMRVLICRHKGWQFGWRCGLLSEFLDHLLLIILLLLFITPSLSVLRCCWHVFPAEFELPQLVYICTSPYLSWSLLWNSFHPSFVSLIWYPLIARTCRVVLSTPFHSSRSLSLLGWLLNKKAARVEVNISLAFLQRVGIALHPWPVVSDIAIFVLKGDVKLQLTDTLPLGLIRSLSSGM